MPKVAVLLYIYYPEKWNTIKQLLLQIKDYIDLFVAVCEDVNSVEVIKDCKKNFKPRKVILVKNKGLDLHPFLKQIEMLDENKYPIFLKLHTKSSLINNTLEWFTCLLNSTIGSEQIFKQNLQLLNNKKTGVLCDQNFITTNNERTHRPAIEHLCRILDINYTKVKLGSYMSGSIFFGKTCVFKKTFTAQNIKHIVKLLENGVDFKLNSSSYTHALECVLGYIVTRNNFIIEPCYTPSLKLFNNQLNKELTLIVTYNSICYIRENPLMHGLVTKRQDALLEIVWFHCDEKTYSYKLHGSVYIRETVNTPMEEFNALEYKCLQPDLLQLSDSEAYQHFTNHGKLEGRVERIDKIVKVFNNEYYSKEYGTTVEKAFDNYMEKGRFEGRLFAPEIIQKHFDYGFYISYKNCLGKSTVFNMYDAFFEDDERYTNNLLTFKNNTVLGATCCIYIANISTARDMYYAVNDVQELTKYCKHVIIVSTKPIKEYKCIINPKDTTNFLWYIQSIDKALKAIKKTYKNYIITTNKAVIMFDIKQTLLQLQNSNKDFTSITDCYTQHIYKGVPYYHLQSEMLHFKQKGLNMYSEFIQKFLKESSNTFLTDTVYEFSLTEFLIENKQTIGALLTPTHELEFFWKDLLTLKLNHQPSILHKHKIPVVHKNNLNYFTQLVPLTFKKEKHTFKINNFFNTGNNKYKEQKSVCVIMHVHYKDRVDEFKNYIKQINDKCNATFYITGNKDVFNLLKDKEVKMHYIASENKGMDIGPFLKVMELLYTQKKEYDFILKLQDKATTSWRKYCFNNLIGNLTNYLHLLQDRNTDVGGPYSLLTRLDEVNINTITDLNKRYKIPFDCSVELQSNAFIAGTMFIMKHKCFNNFIKKYNIDLKYEYEMLEQGKVTNMYATNTHAWERVFTCVIPTVMQTKVKCI